MTQTLGTIDGACRCRYHPLTEIKRACARLADSIVRDGQAALQKG